MRFTYGRERSKTARCTTADKSLATEDAIVVERPLVRH